MSALDSQCAFCGGKLPERIRLFCSICWWKLPAPERASLHRMVIKGRNVDSKIAKCVRLLKETPKT